MFLCCPGVAPKASIVFKRLKVLAPRRGFEPLFPASEARGFLNKINHSFYFSGAKNRYLEG